MKKSHPSFGRFLHAASKLQGWNTPAVLAQRLTEAGYEVSEQTINNWSRRGVSKEGNLRSAPIIGFRPDWLATGEGVMEDSRKKSAGEAHPGTGYIGAQHDPYQTNERNEIAELFALLSEDSQKFVKKLILMLGSEEAEVKGGGHKEAEIRTSFVLKQGKEREKNGSHIGKSGEGSSS